LSYLETLLVILHRWRLSVPAILLALVAGGTAFFLVPPGYEDSAQVLFIGSPNQPGEKVQTNPYLALSSTLVSTADVIRLTVTTEQTADALAGQGARAAYEVALDQSTPAPVLLVTAKGSDPQVTRRTNLAVVDEIQRLLDEVQLQAGAPRATWVSSTVIARLPKPVRKLNQSLRPAIGATVGVLAISFFGLFLLEGRRRRDTAQSNPKSVSQEQLPARMAPAPAGISPRRQTRPRQVTLPTEAEGRAIWKP
jgi:capsular polysaccharide biosynthesis protein